MIKQIQVNSRGEIIYSIQTPSDFYIVRTGDKELLSVYNATEGWVVGESSKEYEAILEHILSAGALWQ